MKPRIIILCLSLFVLNIAFSSQAASPLPSWNDSSSKEAIISYVESVTNKSSPTYVRPNKRIAVFDNDGTLWSEKPIYFQFIFAMDRVRQLAGEHPEWRTRQPFQAVLENDMETLAKSDKRELLELLMATHAGMTTAEFTAIVEEWIKTATHPTLHKPFTSLVYQPMLELLEYLKEHDFKTYIVSGGGIEFMRPWVEEIYGIPPERVVGSSIVTKFEIREGQPVLVREPKIDFIDDKEGKPVGINRHIGQRPIFAFGNSDGDLQMLQWTALAGDGKRFAGIVHHTDGEREFSYDKKSHVGNLDKALIEAEARGWTVVDMKNDWKVIYPPEKK